MLNIVKQRYLYFGISLVVIVPGLLALILWGLPLGIDFTGGSLLDARFESGSVPQPGEVVTLYEEFGFDGALVQTSGTDAMIVRSRSMDEETRTQIVSEIEKRFAASVVIQRFESVG